MHHLLENSDFSFLLDNETSCDTWKKYFKVSEVTYGDLNHHYTFAMAGVTSMWRVPNLLNLDLRKFAVNMVPFPRPHFLMVSLAPLTHRGSC
jgi:tubulin beta